jgi:hypothetical protein
VYLNPENEVVIRQKAFAHDDEDPFIVIPRDRVPALIEALQREATARPRAGLD